VPKSRKPSRSIPRAVVKTLITPAQQFIHTESSSGIILIAAAVLAFAWANSPWAEHYLSFKETYLGIELGSFVLRMDLLHWVNDLLMAIFFFLVGLEIKRELLVGELDSWQKASLPAAGALGGMIVPALIFVALNYGEPTVRGWGVPMATDIAFALGVLALLGNRVLLPLKVFLLALAIVDDLGAVLVIALFYTENLDITALMISFAVWAAALFYGRADGRRPLAFVALGAMMWYFMFASGVHATIAGVLLAFAIPLRHRMSPDQLRAELRLEASTEFEAMETRMAHIEDLFERARSPLHHTEHTLQPYVAFMIMPVFAFFNAGVALGGGEGGLIDQVSTGAFLGLLLGKPIGVLGFVWLAVMTGITRLPSALSWPGLAGVGLLAGIGFTMSLFIANLAYGAGGELDQAKIGVLAASTVAAVLGLTFLHYALPSGSEAGRVRTEGAPAD
jgi:Na+:H+ antiporter, NhaA family